MVTATSTSQKAKTKLSGERRHGKTREDFEQQLVSYIPWADLIVAIGGGRHHFTDPDTGSLHGLGNGPKSQVLWNIRARPRSGSYPVSQ